MKSLWSTFVALASGSASLLSSIAFAASGAAFALGNLLLARQMSTESYAAFALGTSIYIICTYIATLGMNQISLRRRIDPDARLFWQLIAQGAVVAALTCIALIWVYGFSIEHTLLLAIAITTGGFIWTGTAMLQREDHKLAAFGMQTIPDWVVLMAGVLVLTLPAWADLAPLPLYCIAVTVLALAAWLLHALRYRVPRALREPIPWNMILPMTGVVAGGVVITQIERVTIPLVLDAPALAMFGVLTSVAIFPFRLVTAGASFALVPNLRRTTDPAARRAMVRREILLISGAMIITTIGVCLLAPPVAAWLTADRYLPDIWLVFGACVNGAAKVAQVIPRAVITACGSEYDMHRLNGHLWLGILCSALGSLAGLFGGLPALLIGMGIGATVGTLPLAVVARRAIGA